MMIRILIAAFVAVEIVKCHPHPEEAILKELDHETHLFFHLFDEHHYVNKLRPAASFNTSVVVTVDLTLTSIQGLDESRQQLMSTLLLLLSWEDPRLRWNMSDYGGVQSLTVPAGTVWKPDIKLLHSQYGSFEHFDNELVRVYPNGAVSWSSHARIRSYCPLALYQFPFDLQICRIQLASNIYTAKQIHLKFPTTGLDISVTKSMLTTNMDPQWTLVSRTVEGRIGHFVQPESFEFVTVSVQLQRRSSFYQCVVVGPAVILALLVPVVFLVPSESSGKTTLGILILLTLSICLKTLCDIIGHHRATAPRIALFYVVTMALTSISVICSAMVTATARVGPSKRALPHWLSRVFLGNCGLRRVLCMDPYSPSDRNGSDFSPMKSNSDIHENESDIAEIKDGDGDLREVNKSLRALVGKYSFEQAMRDVDSEWREMARVVDRLLFLVFVVLFMLTSLSVLS